MTKPIVSVLMPVYNEEHYVCQAIDSIFNQTFTDFELILVEDGSTDNTRNILTDYASRESRVVLVENETNRGLVYSLNRGLTLSRGDFIARMDANDISFPERLAKQVSFLEQHSEVGVLGTNFIYIDQIGNPMFKGRSKDINPPTQAVIKWMLLWRCAIYHTTVMVKRSILEQTGFTYDPVYRHAEDFELWTRLIKYTVIASLPDALVYVRVVPSSISSIFRAEQSLLIYKISRRETTSLLQIKASDEAVDTLVSVFSKHKLNINIDYLGASDILFEVYYKFLEEPLSDFDQRQIQADVVNRLIAIAKEASKYSSKIPLILLFRLRFFSIQQICTVNIVIKTFKVILNSFGIRRKLRSGE